MDDGYESEVLLTDSNIYLMHLYRKKIHFQPETDFALTSHLTCGKKMTTNGDQFSKLHPLFWPNNKQTLGCSELAQLN